jgi:hypothetical protein
MSDMVGLVLMRKRRMLTGGGSGFGGFGRKGKMLIRKKKWSGSVEQKAEWRAAWKCVRWSRDANIASL